MLLIGYLLLALVVAAVLFYLVVALLPSGLSVRPIRDNRPLELPADRRMRITDLDRVRIPVSLRGYRFAETDELIDRLAAEIQVRDEEIARLKQHGAPYDAAVEEPPAEQADLPMAEPEWAVRDLGDDVHPAADAEEPEDDPAETDPAEPTEKATPTDDRP